MERLCPGSLGLCAASALMVVFPVSLFTICPAKWNLPGFPLFVRPKFRPAAFRLAGPPGGIPGQQQEYTQSNAGPLQPCYKPGRKTKPAPRRRGSEDLIPVSGFCGQARPGSGTEKAVPPVPLISDCGSFPPALPCHRRIRLCSAGRGAQRLYRRRKENRYYKL